MKGCLACPLEYLFVLKEIMPDYECSVVRDRGYRTALTCNVVQVVILLVSWNELYFIVASHGYPHNAGGDGENRTPEFLLAKQNLMPTLDIPLNYLIIITYCFR